MHGPVCRPAAPEPTLAVHATLLRDRQEDARPSSPLCKPP